LGEVSDTPRTDNEAWSEGSSVPELVTAELARKLERERNTLAEWQRAILAAFHPDCKITTSINSLRGRTFKEA